MNNAILLLKKEEYRVLLFKYANRFQVFLASDWLNHFLPFLSTSLFTSIFTSLLLKVYSFQPRQHLHFMSKYYILLGAFYFCLHNSILPFLQNTSAYSKSHIQNTLSLFLSIPFTTCVVHGLRASSPSRAYLLAMYLGLPFLYTVPSVHCIMFSSSREGTLLLCSVYNNLLLYSNFIDGTLNRERELQNYSLLITSLLQIGAILLGGDIWAGASFFLFLFYSLLALQYVLLRMKQKTI